MLVPVRFNLGSLRILDQISATKLWRNGGFRSEYKVISLSWDFSQFLAKIGLPTPSYTPSTTVPWCLIPNIVHFQIVGLIVPPLPPQSGSDPHSAESKTKKQFGSSARAMIGDDFKVEAKCLERFLQQMLCHPIFGRDKHLEEFLMQKHPPIRYD